MLKAFPCFASSLAIVAMAFSPPALATVLLSSREAIITLPTSSLPMLAGSNALIERGLR